ncbi:hypothetical protein EON64_06040 [archaeon]|nr:MAG: hypothetical protein EON64_06040 [archaeon]
MARSITSLIAASELTALPQLIVFDLDHCLWLPEMYTLDEIPKKRIQGSLCGRGDGAIGVMSGHQQIKLFPDALRILQEIYLDIYPGIRIAAASSADTPRAVSIARAAMGLLEILPGVTMRDAFAKGWPEGFSGNLQIGRSPPLSSDKAISHFPILRRETGIEYDKMVFFDDCNWEDNCANVSRRCTGVVTQCTPHGLTIEQWNKALKSYSDRHK